MAVFEHGALCVFQQNRHRRHISPVFIGLIILLQSLVLQAEENTFEWEGTRAAAGTITLYSALQRTLAENPELQIFQFRKKSLEGALAAASLRPVKSLAVELENFSGSGEFNGFDQTELTVSLSSIVELGGKREARMDIVNRRVNRLEAQRQADSLDLSGEVTRRFIDVLSAQHRVALAETADKLAREALSAVKARARAGASADVDVKRALAAAAQTHLTVSSEKQRLSYVKVALASLWGDSLPDFSRVSGDLYSFNHDISFDTLYHQVEQNPAVLVFASEQRLKDAQLRLAQTQSRTDISWSVGLRRIQATDDTAIVAGFSVPLFEKQRNRGALVSARAAREEVAVQRKAKLLTLRAQLYRAYSSRRQAIHIVADLRNNIVPALEQVLEETRQAYERGRYSYIDYVSARQELLSARRALIDAAAAALRYGADIEQLTAVALTATAPTDDTGVNQ